MSVRDATITVAKLTDNWRYFDVLPRTRSPIVVVEKIWTGVAWLDQDSAADAIWNWLAGTEIAIPDHSMIVIRQKPSPKWLFKAEWLGSVRGYSLKPYKGRILDPTLLPRGAYPILYPKEA